MTFVIASAVSILDWLTKYIVIGKLHEGQSIKVLPGILHITLVLNEGTVFGLLKGYNLFFIVLSFIIIAIIIAYTWKHMVADIVLSAALGLILGGAMGNLIDRIKFGCVIDFLDLRVWPVFNVADACITIGTAVLTWRILAQKAKFNNREVRR